MITIDYCMIGVASVKCLLSNPCTAFEIFIGTVLTWVTDGLVVMGGQNKHTKGNNVNSSVL